MPVDPPLAPDPTSGEVRQRAGHEGWAERVRALDRAPAFPREPLRQLAEAGWLGMTYPPDLGGRGWPLQRVGRTLFEIARWGGTMYGKLALQPEFCRALARAGSPELRRAYFDPMMRGELVVGNQVTEPDAGSDLRAIRARAVRRGESYRLSGTKSQAAFAVDAAAAIVYVHLEGEAGRERDLTAFVVPQEGAGISRTLVGDHGERWMRRGTVRYDDVELPAAARLGPEHGGMALLREELAQERALLGAIYLGVAWASWEATVEYVGGRAAFGQPLAAQQGVAFPLVEDLIRLQAAGAQLDRLLARADAGLSTDTDAALSKWYCGQVALEAVDHAVQFHGGSGYSEEWPHERRLRDLRSARLAHGTDEIMHLVAARALWRPPRSEPRAPKS